MIGTISEDFRAAISSLLKAKKDFAAKELTPVQHGDAREKSIAQALDAMAKDFGVRLQKPLFIDSRGEFKLYALKDGFETTHNVGCGKYGEGFAEAINKRGARTGFPGPNQLGPNDGWCMMNHFAAEKMVLEHAGALLSLDDKGNMTMDNHDQVQDQSQKSIYQMMKESGVEIGNHESDLYVPVTEETKKILSLPQFDTHKTNATTFTSQIDKKRWFDIPFSYDPWWEKRQHKTQSLPHGDVEYQGWTNSATFLTNQYLLQERVPYEILCKEIEGGADFQDAQFKRLVTQKCGLKVEKNKTEEMDEEKGCGLVGKTIRLDSWAEGEVNWDEIGKELGASLGVSYAVPTMTYVGKVVDLNKDRIRQEIEPGVVVVHQRESLGVLPLDDRDHEEKLCGLNVAITYGTQASQKIMPAGFAEITPNSETSGKIVSETPKSYIQSLGRNAYAVIDKQMVDRLSIGHSYNIKFKDGQANVTENVKSVGPSVER